MIILLTQAFNFLATVLQQVLYLASFVGQLIVITLSSLINFIFRSLKSALVFFQIVYEDNVFIFTEELPNYLSLYFETVCVQYLHIKSGLWLLSSEIIFKITSLLTSISTLIDTLLLIFFEIFMTLKKTLLLLGDALWILITFIPFHLPYLLRVLVNYIKEFIITLIIDMYKSLLKFTNFLSDVPFESFIGIMTAIALIRFYIMFQVEIHLEIWNIYFAIVRKLWYFYYSVYNYFIDTNVAIIARIANGEQIMTRDIPPEDVEEINPADALCVICQERQKCVLILPCKHVCLCRECCLRLYGYQRTCPICRTFIYHSVTIYL
ncbi:uncharacterized protein LOC123720602 [Pieris brassicae]|uniref:uncharacterized protein LOC123720602 n=1 Tax=Pieris brassicae TaxID=7116 RepID=UPI001E65F743|nr:uncharacterized protein LOC123720602 [Pieris brassicae]